MPGKNSFKYIVTVSILLLCHGTGHALDCPAAPAQFGKDLENEVNVTVAKIGFVRGGELRTKIKNTTQDLLGKLPDADKVYLEQMMYSSYCSVLRDDLTINDDEKTILLKEYDLAVRMAIAGQRTNSPKVASKGSNRNELSKMSLAFTPEDFIGSAKKGDVAAVKLYLAADMDPDTTVDNGNTALMHAAGQGHLEIMNVLIKDKADVNKMNHRGHTALSWAAENKEAMLLLLKNGPNKDAVNKAFVSAAECANVEGLQLLLDHGADVNKVGAEALLAAAAGSAIANVNEESRRQTIDYLLGLGIDVNSKDKEGWTALLLTADRNYLPAMRTLLDKGADVNAKCVCEGYLDGGWTGLMIAIDMRSPEAVTILLDKGADVNLQNNKGQTALMIAVQEGDADMARALLDRGADVKARDKKGTSALMVSAQKGELQSVQALLDKGADLAAKDSDGWTPLMFAVSRGHADCVRLLLDKKAEINEKTANGKTALMLAARFGYVDLAGILLERGARVNEKDVSERTALGSIAEKLDNKTKAAMVLLLKKAGAQ